MTSGDPTGKNETLNQLSPENGLRISPMMRLGMPSGLIPSPIQNRAECCNADYEIIPIRRLGCHL